MLYLATDAGEYVSNPGPSSEPIASKSPPKRSDRRVAASLPIASSPAARCACADGAADGATPGRTSTKPLKPCDLNPAFRTSSEAGGGEGSLAGDGEALGEFLRRGCHSSQVPSRRPRHADPSEHLARYGELGRAALPVRLSVRPRDDDPPSAVGAGSAFAGTACFSG